MRIRDPGFGYLTNEDGEVGFSVNSRPGDIEAVASLRPLYANGTIRGLGCLVRDADGDGRPGLLLTVPVPYGMDVPGDELSALAARTGLAVGCDRRRDPPYVQIAWAFVPLDDPRHRDPRELHRDLSGVAARVVPDDGLPAMPPDLDVRDVHIALLNGLRELASDAMYPVGKDHREPALAEAWDVLGTLRGQSARGAALSVGNLGDMDAYAGFPESHGIVGAGPVPGVVTPARVTGALRAVADAYARAFPGEDYPGGPLHVLHVLLADAGEPVVPAAPAP